MGGALALAGVSVVLLVRRGPLSLDAPRTIYSNAHPAQRGSEPLLLLLKDARAVLPSSATVVVLPANPADANSVYLIAVGQLPEQHVLPPGSMGSAEFLLFHGTGEAPPGFRRIRDFPSGSLFRRAQ